MMHPIRRLFRDDRGAALPKIAFFVGVIGMGSVATADVLDYMSRRHGDAILAVARDISGVANPSDPGIDYMATASIRQRPIVLDPCTGHIKSE